MKVTDHIRKAKSTFFSIEILPPLKGKSVQEIFDCLDPLMEFKPPFVDVTYHREEFVYRKRASGYLEKVSIRKRPGTVGICAGIINRYKVDPVPHLICGGFTRHETENALIDLSFLGIENILVLRGDARKNEGTFVPEPEGHHYAIDLLHQVTSMNQGKYLDADLQNAHETHFCIGVAAYPEKHFEAPNLKTDLHHLKRKIEDGADYVVTQMFFDNQKYFDFVKACRELNITVPIIPGLKPVTSRSQIANIPKSFYIDIPEALTDAIMKCKTDEDAKQLGIEWCIQQSKELIKFGVPCLHYYSMSKPDSIVKIAREVF
jgi:methylenetetrahydrofolate reductase (NADPH)